MPKGPTQKERILEILRQAKGEWVCGQYFNDPPVRISQFHTRIFELQRLGYVIESSTFTNQYGFKSYKLISEPSKTAPIVGCCSSLKIFGTHSRDCAANQSKAKEQTKQVVLL